MPPAEGKGGRGLGSRFLELLKNITVFLLAGQVILHFLPEGGYEKYARIIIGIMALSQIALPLLSLGGFDAGAVFTEALAEYEQEMQRIESQVEQAELKEGGYAQEGLEAALSDRLSGFCTEWEIRLVSASLDENGILHITVEPAAGAEEGAAAVEEIRVEQIRVGETAEENAGEAAGGRTEETETGAEELGAEELRPDPAAELESLLAGELGMEPEDLEVIWNG